MIIRGEVYIMILLCYTDASLGPFGPWSECDKCGLGKQKREAEYVDAVDSNGKPYTVEEERVCYKTCPDSE